MNWMQRLTAVLLCLFLAGFVQWTASNIDYGSPTPFYFSDAIGFITFGLLGLAIIIGLGSWKKWR